MIRSAVADEEMDALRRLAAGKIVLELGSYAGRSTIGLAEVAAEVHAVDWFRGDESGGEEDTLLEYFFNIEAQRDRIITHVGRFADVVPRLQPVFDLAFLDGGHSFDATMEQIDLALSVLKPEGVIAFHDYGSGFEGVRQAIDERFENVEVVRTLAWTTI